MMAGSAGPHQTGGRVTVYDLHIGFEIDDIDPGSRWLAYVHEMRGISAFGPTREAALDELEVAFQLAWESMTEKQRSSSLCRPCSYPMEERQ